MIFEDPTSLRWRRAQWLAGILCVIALGLLAGAIAGLTVPPSLPSFGGFSDARMGEMEMVTEPAAPPAVGTHPAGASTPLEERGFLRTAFVIQDERSMRDLRDRIDDLDAVFPDWLFCTSGDGTLTERVDPGMLKLLREHHAAVVPRLANVDASGTWRSEAVAAMMRNWVSSQALIAQVTASLRRVGAQGVNIDFEGLVRDDREPYLDFLGALAGALHREHLVLTVDLPINEDAFDYEAIGQIADFVIVMGYDEHFPGGQPGPIASVSWFSESLDDMVKRIPPRKLIAALGAYGYDWPLGSHRPAESLSFTNAMVLATDRGAEIRTDSSSLNSYFYYRHADGSDHEVWLLDAVSAWNQWLALRRNECRGVSLWRLGMEDPGIWGFLNSDPAHPFDPGQLATVTCDAEICFKGEGELLRVTEVPKAGVRDLGFDGPLIDYAAYESFPTCFTVQRSGRAGSKTVALTFDDGPDATWTPEVLDVLKRNDVRATFFVVGQQVQAHPDVLRRVWEDGHLIGSHSYSHPNIETISEAQLAMELNVTQRLIESVTGHQALLFRPPYDSDTSPVLRKQLQPLHVVNSLGYVVAGADVDSEDYTCPGAEHIVRTIMQRLQSGNANIIVFHDGGGDRRQTVEALARLIPELRAEGYQFVTVNELIGVPRDSFMPAITFRETVILSGQRAWDWIRTTGWGLLVVLFFATTGIAVARIVLLGALVLRRGRARRGAAADFMPPVLVLIPARNEAKVIERTLRSLLESDYPDYLIRIVDDGSTDDTPRIVAAMAEQDSRISLATQAKGGKSAALNRGFRASERQYIITIDADTLVGKNTIRELIAPFADPKVDAVCGNVQVGNVKNVLTAFQDVEYVTSQNYDRRAFDAVNCIAVVPGATGAWKRDAVLDVGGYSSHTLTEDADLTVTLLRNGATVVYAPEGKSITEAPETVRALFQQRFRWSFGTFQCLWKHRRALGHGSLGWLALPNMLVFQIIFPLLSPIGDLVLIGSILRGHMQPVLAGYLLFVLMDLAGSGIAFVLDGRKLSRLWVVLIQRFYYRQFMYVVAIRSLLAAVRGKRHGWHKLRRHGFIAADAIGA